MSELSPQTQKLIRKYQNWWQSIQPKENVATIHIDEIASSVVSFYEKIKGLVDWNKKHLLRKRAIERSLKKRIIFKTKNSKIAESLVYELVRGGYFPNNIIPEERIKKVQKILDKYFFILQNAPKKTKKEKRNLQNWLMQISSYEIEKTLSPPHKEEALMEYMTNLIKERVEVREGIITKIKTSDEEKNTQIYIAVQRALFKLDSSTISFYLLRKNYPEWENLCFPSPILLKIVENIYSLKKQIKDDLSHPLSEKFYNICQKYNTPYLILDDIITEDPTSAQEKLENPETLENLIKTIYNEKIIKLKGRLKRALVYSTIFVFVTKIVLLLAIEIPFDKYIIGQFNSTALGINILFPTFLMFFLVAITIKTPKKENYQRIIMEVMKICYNRERKDVYEIRILKKRGKVSNAIIFTIYLLAFLVSFGVIILILDKLNFGILSMGIFIFYISLISFLGIKIKENSRELSIQDEKETFFQTLLDFFSFPIIRMGKWFSEKWEKLNLALIITLLIDVPFLTFIEFIEQWRYFLKDKKKEIH